ncbi:hypothetical protein AgCh_006002 [Apium graveolens]
MVIPAHYAPKDPSNYTEPEKEKVSLDSSLQLILIESLDNYEGFMAKPKDSIIDVFKRFKKLINDLQLHDKYNEAEEVNLKFFITLPDHLEQKISTIREGRDLSWMTLEVLFGILKNYQLEMIQRKSLRAGQGHIIDGSSALVVNVSQSSNDEQEIQTPVVSSNEQKNKEPQKPVILELEEDKFYTLDELDELDQSMAYLARKFSNIRVKKPKSKIRCFNYDELGHFATECRKPKKVKKDKAYLELKAKYEDLLRKQQGKTDIAKGKSWDDSDNDEDGEFENYALMAWSKDSHLHQKQSLVAATEEVSRLLKANDKLEVEKQDLEL